MIRHIVAWKYPNENSPEENEATGKKVKAILEALPEHISGIKELKVILSPLSTGDRDIVLNSLFENQEALENYQVHPKHQEAAVFIKSNLCQRICLDFEE